MNKKQLAKRHLERVDDVGVMFNELYVYPKASRER